jgi:mono/diheme cytochrome c family protein
MPSDPRSPSRTRRPFPWSTAAGASLLALAFACQFEPARPVLRFQLSEATRALDEDGEPKIPLEVQDHIRGSLEMLFGTPQNPQYLLLGEWVEDGFDPNWPSYPSDEQGSGEIGEERLAEIHGDNARAFARQLAAIEAGDYDKVEPPNSAPDLQEKWAELCAQTSPEARGEEFKNEAKALFSEWYPTLRDSAELYRLQCLHCHGVEGGGDGPTGRFLDPRPRDYRKGIFKFTPLKDKAQPRRADLYSILDQGVTGTAMPSFRRLSIAQLEGLVDYVRLLSMRGMVEQDLSATYELDEAIKAEYVVESYSTVFGKWRRSEEEAGELVTTFEEGVPEPTAESIARGRELFMDDAIAKCYTCHGPAGHGDGISAWTVDPETGKKKEAYVDDWGFPIRPRNLTHGLYRGGRRPIDVFRRMKNGINGTPMPALGGALPDEDLWALVHYVGTLSDQNLFYPAAHAAPAEPAAPAGH